MSTFSNPSHVRRHIKSLHEVTAPTHSLGVSPPEPVSVTVPEGKSLPLSEPVKIEVTSPTGKSLVEEKAIKVEVTGPETLPDKPTVTRTTRDAFSLKMDELKKTFASHPAQPIDSVNVSKEQQAVNAAIAVERERSAKEVSAAIAAERERRAKEVDAAIVAEKERRAQQKAKVDVVREQLAKIGNRKLAMLNTYVTEDVGERMDFVEFACGCMIRFCH